MPAPGNAPRTCPRYLFRPARAEDSCALAGRTDRFRSPGRCPGLPCAGAFSAGTEARLFRGGALKLPVQETANGKIFSPFFPPPHNAHGLKDKKKKRTPTPAPNH